MDNLPKMTSRSGIELFWRTLTDQSSSFLDPSRRIFYSALLISLIAAFLFALYQRRGGWKYVWRYTVPWKIYKHPSSKLDVQLFFTNAFFKVFLFTPWLIAASSVAYASFSAYVFLFGRTSTPNWPWWVIASIFSLVMFVVEDFSRFFVHLLMHKIPWLWEFHKIHHSATVLTPLTFFRVHPGEMLLMSLRHSLALGTVSGIFLAIFAGKLNGWDILGVDAFGFLFNHLALANLRHSHVPISFGWFETWLISPAQHQLHHSAKAAHFDKNFGVCFAFWDRMFGTFLRSKDQKIFRFGLSRHDRKYQHFLGAYVAPIKALWASGSVPSCKSLIFKGGQGSVPSCKSLIFKDQGLTGRD